MRKYVFICAVALTISSLFLVAASCTQENSYGGELVNSEHNLPDPITDGEVSLERTITQRRSRRFFSGDALTIEQAGQMLWSAQGITGDEGRLRASPSAGATYPLEVFIAVGDNTVEGLDAGIYLYRPQNHQLDMTAEGDARSNLAGAALNQHFIAAAPMVIIIAADYDRTASRYGERAERYVHMEVGHAGGNIYLQAEALNLGTVAVGAFNDSEVAEVINLPGNLDALYIMPVGHIE